MIIIMIFLFLGSSLPIRLWVCRVGRIVWSKLGYPSSLVGKDKAITLAEIKDQTPVEPVGMGSNRPWRMDLGWGTILPRAFYETQKWKQGENSRLRCSGEEEEFSCFQARFVQCKDNMEQLVVSIINQVSWEYWSSWRCCAGTLAEVRETCVKYNFNVD